MPKLLEKQTTIGYLIKIAGIVVMVWGFIVAMFFLGGAAQLGGQFVDEWGEIQYSSYLAGGAFFGFISILARHALYGILIIGFGEVIDFLQRIYFRLHPEVEQQWQKEKEEKEVVRKEDVPFWVETELKGYYEEQNQMYTSIEKTSDAYIFKVVVDDRVEYVEVGNFKPRVLTEDEAEKYTE
ncbi:hypothetical protein [Sporosarcina sp. ITBMC105]